VCSEMVLQRVQGEYEARPEQWWKVVKYTVFLLSCVYYIDDYSMGFWRIN